MGDIRSLVLRPSLLYPVLSFPGTGEPGIMVRWLLPGLPFSAHVSLRAGVVGEPWNGTSRCQKLQ